MSDISQQAVSVPPPRSGRTEHVAALIKTITDPIHVRLLRAYQETQTVEGVESELGQLLEEIIDET